MLTQTESYIYLDSKRSRLESEGFRSLGSLNLRNDRQGSSKAFGRLLAFNEETLTAGQQTPVKTDRLTEIILLPIVGGLELMDGFGESVFVSPGESFDFLAFPESDFRILNPYPDEPIRYFQIHLNPDLSAEAVDSHLAKAPYTEFSLNDKNRLVPAFACAENNVFGFIGQFDGRVEGNHPVQKAGSGFFVFIIEGAFEVQNRLLERGDALTLINVEALDFEALSNGAIVLVMEVGR